MELHSIHSVENITVLRFIFIHLHQLHRKHNLTQNYMPYTFYVLCTVLFSIHFLYCQIACTSLFSSSLTIMVCRHFFLKWWDFPVPSKIGKKTCHVAFHCKRTNFLCFISSFFWLHTCSNHACHHRNDS